MFNKTRNPLYKQLFDAIPTDANTTIENLQKKTGGKIGTIKTYLSMFYEMELIALAEPDLITGEYRFHRTGKPIPKKFNGSRSSVNLPGKYKKREPEKRELKQYGSGYIELEAGRYTREDLQEMISLIDRANSIAKGFTIGGGHHGKNK